MKPLTIGVIRNMKIWNVDRGIVNGSRNYRRSEKKMNEYEFDELDEETQRAIIWREILIRAAIKKTYGYLQTPILERNRIKLMLGGEEDE